MLDINNDDEEIFEYKSICNIIKLNIFKNNIKSYKLIKYIFILIFINIICYNDIFNYNIFEISDINEEENYNKSIELEIDNKMKVYQYEKNINYSNYSTKIKLIAIYFPNFYLNNFRNKILSLDNKDDIHQYYDFKNEFDNNTNSLESYKYQLNTSNEYFFFLSQIKLAKEHGIYGFGFYIYWFSGKIIFDKFINKFLEIKSINFHFLLILNNRNINFKYNNYILIKKYEKNIIQELKRFLLDDRYIKIISKPVLCVDDNLKSLKKLNFTILSWRDYAKNIGIGDIFIIGSLRNKNDSQYNLKNVYNGGYELLPNFLLKDNLLVNFKDNNSTFFSGLIYKDIYQKMFNNFQIFRTSTLENKLKIKNHTVFGDFNPEYFYIMNKKIINWTMIYHNDSDNLIFVNAWNNYLNGAYLEPNPQFGYGPINSLSKALFNLKFRDCSYNLTNLLNKKQIAIQTHIFYVDLLEEIITKTNNIPVKFDLYITTNTVKKRTIIKEFVNKHSKADNYKIKILENNGRDILPLFNQMRNIFHKYKYFCHIHSKKSRHDPKYGMAWRLYLFKNLLGDSELISNILTDFENNEKLGFVFPETFYEAKVHALRLKDPLKNLLNFLINKFFVGYKIGSILDFPAGDMFWAKSKAVYQIFKIKINKKLCREDKPLTILYALERLWLYIVKMNGYYYKKTSEYY